MDDGLTPEELDKIIEYCDGQGLERSSIMGETDTNKVNKIRRCDVKFHKRNFNNGWIFDRVNNIILSINAQFYGFDLNGYDAFQYTVYNSDEQGTYDWHMDSCLGTESLMPDMIQPRKLTMTLMLNDPDEDFDGGEFEVNLGSDIEAKPITIKRGRALFFPSWMIHRVKPVTRGVRKSLVVWVVGPKFI